MNFDHPRPFRFGVAATPQPGQRWRQIVRGVAELGYSRLVVPDGPQLLAPLPSLAAAAAITDLRVGTFVLASPLRPARTTAWEAHTLTELTDGRFDLGIGTGLPAMVEHAREQLGLAPGSPGERLASVASTIDLLREMDGAQRHTPVLVAAGGPKARALAAAKADLVTLGFGPLTPREEVAELAADVQTLAAEHGRTVEFAINLLAVGDELPPELERFVGVDVATLIARDSLFLLRGDTVAMADELRRRRDGTGVCHVNVNMAFMEQFAPLIERLAGE